MSNKLGLGVPCFRLPGVSMLFTLYFGLRSGFEICGYGRVCVHAHAQGARAWHPELRRVPWVPYFRLLGVSMLIAW